MSTRSRLRARAQPPAPWRVVALVVFVIAGALFVTSSLDARGLDLRGASVTDLDTVVRQQRERTDELQSRVSALNRDVERLGGQIDDGAFVGLQRQVDALKGPAGFRAVRGPALTITLSDAPEEQREKLAKDDAAVSQLVVHQQDIQAVVNALWAGGAEAMSLQNQRIVSTTGIKCVGNTVVLHGVPYAPPYVITAVGNVSTMQQALDRSSYIAGYLTYVAKFDLGYEVKISPQAELPAYGGGAPLRYARVG